MILRLFKSNQAYHFFTIPLMVLALWVPSFINPRFFPFFEGENKMFLFSLMNPLLSFSPVLNHLLSAVFVVLLSFLILQLNTRYAFIRVRTFLPSNIFVLIVSGLLSLHTFHPVYFALLFLILSFGRVFDSYEAEKFHAGSFEAGFFNGIGSLFYLNLIFFLPIIFAGFLMIRKRQEWRTYILTVLGAFIPWLFTWSFYLMTDQTPVFFDTISANFFSEVHFVRGNINLQVYLGFLVLLTLLGSAFLLGQYDEKKISTRKYFQVFFLIFLVAFTLLFAVPSVSQEILVIMSLPLTFVISNYLIYMKRQFWSNLLMYLFLALVIYLQFV